MYRCQKLTSKIYFCSFFLYFAIFFQNADVSKYALGISKKILKLKKNLKIKSLQHQEFPGGPPSKYYPGPMMLNFRDRTRTGVFIIVDI